VLGSALRVVTPAFRPLGGVYYFTLYRLAGFNPVPFRAVCLGLMLANLLLAFALLRRLSGSLEVALLAAVLMTNHPAVFDILYNSGTIYEILCFLFYFLAVWLYLVWRQAGQRAGAASLSWRQLAVLLVLTGCALDSKEMAMTLPGALLLIELVYFPPESWSWRQGVRFAVRQGRGVLAVAALVAPTIAVKVLTHNPLTDDSSYAHHSLRATVENMRGYHNFLLYGDLHTGGISIPWLLVLWAAMAAGAILLRSRPMKFGLLFLIGSLLPVCLIDRRSGYMLYIPLMGWALYVGCLFQRLRDGLLRLASLRPRAATAVRIATSAAAAILIMHLHAAMFAPYSSSFQYDQNDMRRVIERLRKVHPQLARGSSLLLVDDPLPAGFALVFLARLAYGDPALEVDRVKMLRETPAGDELTRYDRVLAGGWDLHDVRAISDARPPVEICVHPNQPGTGNGYTVEIPEFAGKTVDLALRMTGNRAFRVIVWKCALDSSGRAALAAPSGFSPAAILVQWVRLQGGNWMSASGAMDIRR
jgi:hypothetical protein